MAATGDDALIGRVLDDRYVVEERVARGGMASVFKGTDLRLDRTVAIKVMHHGLGDDEQFVQRFDREARAAAKLNHRNVVSVFDQGRDGDVTYLVMEFVPGNTLRDIMRAEAPLPVGRALDLLAEVLVALSAAHAAHLIHRDVKPENVLITPDGEVRVADFGLARAVSAATTATGGTLIGTVSYIAPEIVVNEGADARSDVYACGAMLFEMLTGVKPHAGESPIQVAYKHVHEDIEPPSTLRPDLPDYVDALVLRATARDRRNRSADARVLLQQLRRVRQAVSAGVTSDPDLVAQLAPRPVEEPTDDEATQKVRVPLAAPLPGGPDDSGEPTELVALAGDDASSTRPVAENTVQWSSSEWSPAASPAAARMTPAMSPQDYQDAKEPASSSRRGRIMLVAAVLLALVVGGGAYYFAVARYTEAPVLVGQSEKEAKAEAVKAGFTFEVAERRFSETALLGTVMESDPGAGAKVLPGSTIEVVVSKGKERYAIPNLQGKTVEQARTALSDLNLRLGETPERFSEKIPEGRVIRAVDVKVKQLVKRNTVIDLVISKGREPIDVPDVKGATQAEAKAKIEAADLKAAFSSAFSDTVDKGRVISQDPGDGTLFRDEVVKVVISKGPENVPVPDVMGKERNEAVRLLRAAGFVPRVRNVIPGTDQVRFQSPSGGKAKVGSDVTIYV
ncbi:hypothetical protein ASD11_05250 [Aeromicrobium sp. Root495]|uniref:Stk1 family PASTA domain-containing Ser/Thr kinase n=1 Tax=Aeromicrobium sp. Root495 TaxID=1736550 RepID=UPI0006FE917F|nr:Stk1 family PASTA domain-containing Ser/Thr kinase [Aeromicrobium sp. Root495]KQY59015.1 hypothetical protein ASD11_05250 [Aeromicrobium sp. Root495]